MIFTSWRHPEQKNDSRIPIDQKIKQLFGDSYKLVLYIIRQLFASVSVISGGYLPSRSPLFTSTSANIVNYFGKALRENYIKIRIQVLCYSRNSSLLHWDAVIVRQRLLEFQDQSKLRLNRGDWANTHSLSRLAKGMIFTFEKPYDGWGMAICKSVPHNFGQDFQMRLGPIWPLTR